MRRHLSCFHACHGICECDGDGLISFNPCHPINNAVLFIGVLGGRGVILRLSRICIMAGLIVLVVVASSSLILVSPLNLRLGWESVNVGKCEM